MDVFVYGTLTEPDRVASVVESYAFVGAAVLEGLRPVEGRYPTLVPGGETGGRLLRTDETAALDEYEGVDRGLYVRTVVPRTGGGEVAVYVGDPERLEVREPVEWPGAGSLRERVDQFVRENDVRIRPADSEPFTRG